MDHVRTILAFIAAATTALVVWLALPYIIWLLGILLALCISLGAGAAAYYAVKHADSVMSFIQSFRASRNIINA